MIVDGNTYCRIITPILPPEYQEVEYIESTGTQYINTNISGNQNTIIDADIQQISYNSNNWSVWIGSLKTTSDGNWIHLGQASRNRGLRFSWGTGVGNYIYTDISSSDFNKHKYKIGKGKLTIDNTTEYTLINDDFTTSPSTIVLFADRKGEISFVEYSCIRFFYCKIWDGLTLVRNLIPCYRKSDNEIGMYDTVNGVFYTNQGTGTFLKGPNVYNRYTIKEFDRPYISGHVTDGSSTFTFKVNNNTNITVDVDDNGNWKWYQDRAITSLNRMICFTSTTYTDNIDYLEINANLDNCTNFGVAIALSTLEKVVIRSKTALLTDISYLAQDCVNLKQFYAPNINLGSGSNIGSMFLRCANLEIVDLRSSKIVHSGAQTMFSGCNKLNTLLVDSIKANTKFVSSNVLPKQFIINIINVAQANVTYTLHSTVYNKCASGGEWYTDVQAAIDAKALEGYTVTLISA